MCLDSVSSCDNGSRFIIGNNLFLKLLKTFSLAVKNDPYYLVDFMPSYIFFNLLANLLCLSSALLVYLLKTIGKEYSLKL